MDLKKAKDIFGFKGTFTEEELKKKFYELMKENHPDRHMNESNKNIEEYDDRAKEINEAKEILEKHAIKSNDKNNNLTSDNELNMYDIDSIIEVIKKRTPKQNNNIILYNILDSYYTECEDPKLNEIVKKLIEKYKTKLNGNEVNDKNIIINFKETLKQYYKNYIFNYLQQNPIPTFIIEENILDYDCDCETFYKKIKNCINKINIDINKIIEPIKNKEHYDRLRNKVNDILKSLKSTLKESEITKQQYNKLIDIYSNIVQSLYEKYERNYYRLTLLITLTSSNPNNYETKKNIKQAQNDALELPEEEIIKIYYQTINKLDSKLKNKNDIEKKLNERYELRDLNTPEEKSKARNLYYKILKMLREKNCPIEMILLFNDINFINIDLEEKKVSKFRKVFMRKIKEEPIVCFTKYHSNKLYIAEKKPILNGSKFFYDIRPNINRTLCPSSIFKKIYINIDDFIEQSIFLGEQVYYNYEYERICLLYHNINAGKILCLNENSEFEIIDDIVLKEYHTYKNKHLNIYKDKEYLKYKILKFIQGEQLDNYKKQTR